MQKEMGRSYAGRKTKEEEEEEAGGNMRKKKEKRGVDFCWICSVRHQDELWV
jgi:hypothetical protein